MNIGRVVTRALGLVALAAMLAVGSLGVTVTAALAAPGDYCAFGIDQPGILDAEETCVADASFDPTTIGRQCGTTGTYYNGTMCVANNASCEASPGQSGVYSMGTCLAAYDPPTPPQTDAPGGFVADANAGATPAGEMQPMCVNASPFIGGGMFVVSGTVLCYEGAGRPTGIYGYTDDGANSNGWNPFDRPSWDSLAVTKDLFAGDDITALGTISSFGGAQFYSLNGQNGIQVNDTNVLIRSVDASGRVAAISTKPGEIDMVTVDGLWGAGVEIVANDTDGSEIGRVTTTATNGTSGASTVVDAEGTVAIIATDGTTSSSIVADGATGVRIDGRIGATSDGRIGTGITGSGQGNQAAPASGAASWADVLIGSKNYALDGNLGAGIQVSDHGVVVRSASVGNSYNEFGSAADTQVGAVVTNVIGAGGRGTVYNLIGEAGLVGSIVVNEMGTGNAGGATTNLIGNTNAGTRIGAVAGTSSMTIIQGALDFGTGQGASILASPTQQVAGGSSTSMLGSSSRHVTVDHNGRMTMVDGVAAQATSSMYIVNGRGVTNGVVVTETASTMSGGQGNPTSMALTDQGAHFSRSSDGGPVKVSGIAEGTGPFDAANVRQVHAGIASVAALAGLPAPQPGKNNSMGLALGYHGSALALALGGQSNVRDGLTFKYGAALSYSSGLVESSASVGLGMSW